jgi:hypothetical protein
LDQTLYYFLRFSNRIDFKPILYILYHKFKLFAMQHWNKLRKRYREKEKEMNKD